MGTRPICVVEVKINEWSAAQVEAQLQQYDTFLHQAEEEHGNLTALFLLTPIASPPEGFTDPACNEYHVGLRSIAHWFMVAGWFRGLAQEENGVDEPLKSLAREFSNFLESNTMPTLDDFAIARHYFKRSHRALEQALEVMNEQAVRLSPNGTQGRGLRYGPIGIYKYHYPTAGHQNRFVRFGLCFDPTDENDECLYGYQCYEAGTLGDPKPVRDGFYAFVEVGGPIGECQQVPGYSESQWYELDEDENLVPATDPLPIDSTGWYCYQDNQYGLYARVCPVHELLDDENHVGDGLRTWAHAALQQALQLWRALFGEDQ